MEVHEGLVKAVPFLFIFRMRTFEDMDTHTDAIPAIIRYPPSIGKHAVDKAV